jgi:exodeoxyribonuclease VII large subunit
MSRAGKTQWDFGELFPAAETQARRVLTVAEVTAQVRRLVEGQFPSLWITGEISNLRLQPSGHCYFTLKDADAQLACVLFRAGAASRALLADGRRVNLRGALTVYEARGQYQLRVEEVEAAGVGALQAAFEKLKQRLAAEGLFDAARKRPLPPFPRRVGVVTSPNAAAWRDVRHVIERRFAGLELFLAPARVQGEGAAREIADAIALLNAFSASGETPLDLILVTRGGGSIEDLWAFNEEVVARAIVASALPVVTGIGHEIDTTIADFAADLRAATPSAAAELITAEYVTCRDWIGGVTRALRRLAEEQLETKQTQLDALRHRLERCSPRRKLEAAAQRLDELHARLRRATFNTLRERRLHADGLQRRVLAARPSARVRQLRERFHALHDRLRERVRARLDTRAARFRQVAAQLRLLGPQNALDRGYSITTTGDGRILRSVKDANPGDTLHTRLRDGTLRSVVSEAP